MSSTVAPTRARRLTANLLALAALVALSACSSSTAAGPTATPTSTGPAASTLYLATTASASPPTSTTISALALADGKLRWQSTQPDVVRPMAFNGSYIGSYIYGSTVQYGHGNSGCPAGGTLVAITASSGAQAWQHVDTGRISVPLAANTDAVFDSVVTADDSCNPSESNVIEARRASDGASLWSVPLSKSRAGSAVLGNDTIYLVTQDIATTPVSYTLVALGTADGKLLWQRTLPMLYLGPPAFGGGKLYVSVLPDQPAPTQGHLPTIGIVAVNASNGTIAWQTKAPDNTLPDCSVASDTMVFCLYDSSPFHGGVLMALHTGDGSVAWQKTIRSFGSVSPLTAGGGSVFATDLASFVTTPGPITTAPTPTLTLHAYDAQRGAVRFERPFPTLPEPFVPNYEVLPYLRHTAPQPLLQDGVLYFVDAGFPGVTLTPGTHLGTYVVALSASDGALRWERALDGTPMEGTFFFGP